MQRDNDRVQAFTRALKALAGGETEAAAEIARGLLRRWPEDPSAHQLMAAVALRKMDSGRSRTLGALEPGRPTEPLRDADLGGAGGAGDGKSSRGAGTVPARR